MALLPPVMTSLTERLRVKYGDTDDVEGTSKKSSKRDHKERHHKKTFQTATKLFQNKTSSEMSEACSIGTDSGIYSTTEMSEVTLNANSTACRGQLSSLARVKSYEKMEKQFEQSQVGSKSKNMSSTKFYKSDKEKHSRNVHFSSTSKIRVHSSKNTTSSEEFTLSLPRNNQLPRVHVSPAASEIITTGLTRSKYDRSARTELDDGDDIGVRVVPGKVHQSVPARESSVCEGKGKCQKPVCFVCIM